MRNTETYNTLQKPEILFPTMKPLEKNDGANTKSEGENQAVVTRNVSTNSVRIDLSKVKIEPLFEEFVDFETFAKLLLTSMMSECAKSFERLPILVHADILRNILYSGVWSRYEYLQLKKKKQQEKKAKRGKANVKSL